MKKVSSILILTSLFVVLFLPVVVRAVTMVGGIDIDLYTPQCNTACGRVSQTVNSTCYCGSTPFKYGEASANSFCLFVKGKSSVHQIFTNSDASAAYYLCTERLNALQPGTANPSTNPAGNVIVTETSITTVEGLLAKIETIYTYVFTGLLALAGVFLVIAGYFFVTGGSEPEKVNKARQMLINALIGVAIGVLGKGLIAVIGNLLK